MRLPSEAEMRAEFHRLKAEAEKIMERAKPHRDAYDKARQDLAEQERRVLEPLVRTMTAAEAGLHDIQQQMAQITRLLKGQTGDPAQS